MVVSRDVADRGLTAAFFLWDVLVCFLGGARIKRSPKSNDGMVGTTGDWGIAVELSKADVRLVDGLLVVDVAMLVPKASTAAWWLAHRAAAAKTHSMPLLRLRLCR